ncbi:MAG: hypothetical protein PHC88_03665 [Terrimicrobiaceae bacterium]|nr:hypothetical protein [Terrimicrobiaceae bacterium]
MRTTLTLDDDVAALLREALKSGNASLKAVVNEGLRRGLSGEKPSGKAPVHRTATVDPGRCLMGRIEDAAELIALAEGLTGMRNDFTT